MTFSSKNIVANRYGTATTLATTTGTGSSTQRYNMPSTYGGFSTSGGGSMYYFTLNYGSGNSIKWINNSASLTLPSTNTSYSGGMNKIIVNNGVNNWTLTLPLGVGGGTSTWISGTFQITIKKTGSGTLTIQTPSDTAGTRVRGINTTSNKSYTLSSSSAQSVTLVYTAEYSDTGNAESTAEIWYVINDTVLNPVNVNGSILFDGTTSRYLTLAANDNQLNFRTGDFTVEWWQYQTDSNNAPRIFSMGTYPTATIGVSIEGGTFYFWINGAANSFGSVGTYKNVFTHFAVTRSGSTIRVFKNGTQLGSNLTSSYDFNDTTNNLRIGNEQSLTNAAAFGGNLKGFHWVKGAALYTSNFTPNYNSITPTANTHLLLNVTNSTDFVTDTSGLNKTVTNTGCTFSSITHPFY